MAAERTDAVTRLETLADLLDGLERAADSTAVISFGDTESETISRGTLKRDVERLAAGLLERKVAAGDRVALCGGTSVDWVMVALGAIRAGAVVVPIDAQLDKDNLTHILKDSQPRLLFTDSEHWDTLDELVLDDPPETFLLQDAEAGPYWRELLAESAAQWPRPDAEDVVVLFYTSGTTGPPKGVPLVHRNLVFQINTVAGADIATSEDHVLLSLPLHHVYPFVMGFLTPLAVRAPLVLPSALTGPQMLRAIQEGDVSVMIGVPRLYRALYEGIHGRLQSGNRVVAGILNLAEWLSGVVRQTGLFWGHWLLYPLHRRIGGRLRLMASGGSALDPDLGKRLEAMGWRVTVGYGLTETAPLLTLRRPGIGPLETAGQPIPGVDLRIDVDAVERRRAEEGEESAEDAQAEGPQVGEIQARGPGVFKGYRNRDEDSRKAFTEDGWFRTGDLGYFDDDKYLHITGRLSTMIVTEGGENVQPDDVEAAYERHPFIKEAGVLERDRRLVGLVVPDIEALQDAGQSNVTEALQRAVRTQSAEMPSYMRLSSIRITREALPRTRLGKIRRRQLEDRYDESGSDRAKAGGKPMPIEQMSEDDRALLENTVAHAVWNWLCDRYPEHGLTPDTSPQMDLDIDSMEWLNLTLEIRERTGAEIDEAAIARVSTVRDLLREAASAQTDGTPAADPVEDPMAVLSDDQQRWLTPLPSGLHAVALLLYGIAACLLRLAYRIRVEGEEHVPEDRACVLAPNHTSYLDPFVLGYVLGARSMPKTYWAGLATAAFNSRLKRWGCRLGRAVPITPQHGAVRGLAFAAAVLKRDQRLVWFPEGQRSPTGDLQELKPGLGKVLDRIDVPVIPVHIGGTHEAWPVHRRLPRPGRITVTFGEPTSADELRELGSGDTAVKRITEGLAEKLEALS